MFFLFFALLLAGGLAHAQSPAIGVITLKLGEAWIVDPNGTRRPAATDERIYLGEALETAASGHLHVRFTDKGVVAVRPASRLVVEDYRDPRASGGIRFRLEKGTVRSITGEWGRAEHGRFRLNTPIAAIGITGTDFVVQGDSDLLRAIVYEGGIVVAPFDSTCRPEGFGSCGGEHARLLTADDGLMVEIRRGDPAPRLVPRNGLAGGDDGRRLAESAASNRAESLTQAAASESLSSRPPLPATLVWGHWAHVPSWPDDTLSVPREVAAAGRERVAENRRYVLYRLPQAEPLPTGTVHLTLTGAQAHLVRTDGVLPAQVLDGRLTLDFAGRRFDTALTLTSGATGDVPFSAAGPIRPDGTFGLIEWQNRVQGAYGVGGSGPSAGYLFERTTPQGMFMGITLWR